MADEVMSFTPSHVALTILGAKATHLKRELASLMTLYVLHAEDMSSHSIMA